MAALAWRVPLSLDPLIAEAKRRARQRRFLVAVAVFLVAAAGSAAALVVSNSSDLRSLQAALAPSVLEAPHNNLVGGTHGHFSILVGLTNGAGKPVSLERVHAVLDARSTLRQYATQFVLYKRPVCSGMVRPGICVPDYGFGASTSGARRHTPLRVAPGHEALVQLTFGFATCTSRALLESVSIREFTVVYGLPNGTRIDQHPRLPLGQPAALSFAPATTIRAVPAHPGQPASPRIHTVAWVTTNPCHN
jgi:hypothetical protein